MLNLIHWMGQLDQHLLELSQQYGALAYVILFLIIFSETGLVVAPFLPGDTLLFVAGAVAAAQGGSDLANGSPGFSLPLLLITLTLAAFLGNQVNFQVGRWLGPKVFHWERSRVFNPRHLAEAHAFYERHGGKTVILSRFLPIIRTYAPFVAGVGAMSHSRFLMFNAAGALLWVGSLLLSGFFFGNVPVIKGNLTLIILGIVVVTLLPVLLAFVRTHLKTRQP